VVHPDVHSLPPRRSSDLSCGYCTSPDVKATRAPGLAFAAAVLGALAGCAERSPAVSGDDGWGPSLRGDGPAEPVEGPAPIPRPRSEEHTSELQSREKLVC